MIPIAAGARIWIATGHTDMRKGMQGLALLVQESLGRDPFAGDVFVFRGRAGTLIKALWHDGIGLSLYAKRLDRGRFIWPATVDGVVSLTAAQMFEAINGMLLDMLAVVAWKDYDDRRRRQAQGEAKAKAEGRYKGRPEDVARNSAIAKLLETGQSWTAIPNMTGCSRATIAKVAQCALRAAEIASVRSPSH